MFTIWETDFQFDHQIEFYRGKVRDVYIFDEHLLVISTDRISAFDTVLPEAIPFKGQVLNQLSHFFLDQTQSEVPNWKISCPDPNVTWGWKCEPIPIEMVIRAHLAGSAWRAYAKGQRNFNGFVLPDGLKENDPLPQAIITPSTKAEKGAHDEDISKVEILEQNIVSEEVYQQLETYTQALFRKGQSIAAQKGLILADTKYEFGFKDGNLMLMDEIHTPDSSRYFDQEGFDERQQKGERQAHRSKEKVRQWLMENGFKGQAGEKIPGMAKPWIQAITEEYIALYEELSGERFRAAQSENRLETMKKSIDEILNKRFHSKTQ